MYLPFGPENATLRRIPWATLSILALLGLNWVYHLFAPMNLKPLMRAMNYQASHPWLQGDEHLAVMIQMNPKFVEKQNARRPGSEEEKAIQQEELNQLIERGLSALEKTPLRTWGLYTGSPQFLKFPAHIFYHQRIYPLILNVLLLIACAMFIEDLWGRVFFPIFFVVGGMVSAFGPILLGHAPIYLYGATGAVCAVIGAFAYRFRNTSIRVFSIGFMYSGKEFYTRPLPIIVTLFILELLFAFITRDYFTTLAITVWSHFFGFSFGLATAWVVARFQLELKLYASEYDQLPEDVKLLSDADFQLNHNEKEAAWQMLEQGVKRFPENWEILEKYWDLAVRLGRPKQAVHVGKKLVDYFLEERAPSEAYFHWKQLREAFPSDPINPKRLTSLVNQLAATNERERAVEALRHGMDHLPSQATSQQIFSLIEAAEFTDPKSCLKLIAHVLDSLELGPEETASLQALQKELPIRFPEVEKEDEGPEAIEISPAHLDPSMVLEVADPFSPTHIKKLTAHQGVPISVDTKGLTFKMGAKTRVLGFGQIKAVSVGAIRHLSGKPFLLIDLLTDHPMMEKAEHKLLRLHSHQFSPLVLAAEAPGPVEAIKQFVDRLLRESQALPLPDEETLTADKFPSYPSLHDYEIKVYGISNG